MDVGLVVLDGWGINPDPQARDAVASADTPAFDRFRAAGASDTLRTDGRTVGLPEGQMGNSEVGHLTIGAGRVIAQESARISDAIARWRDRSSPDSDPGPDQDPADPPLDENEAIATALARVGDTGGRVHLLGLISDGGVHAYQSHVHALIDLAAEQGVEAVTHAFTDGRDTAPTGGAEYLAALQAHAADRGTGDVATVSGRYYAMDRDENWERTRRAYDAIVNREADHTAESAVAAVERSYDRGDTDEFVEPMLVSGGVPVSEGDAVIFVNFRSDRARQLTRMIGNVRPGDWPFATDPPECHVVTMTEYDATFDLPVAFPSRQPTDTLGEVLSAADRTQLRIAETEKYAHVTYFFNGGREVEFAGERRRIVPSPDVPTYDRRPEMSAPEVTDTALDEFRARDPDAVVLNYANPDMVGHTGDFDATVAAVEAVDTQLERLVGGMTDAGGHVLIAADHGNAEEMGTPEAPHTAHTTNPVPVVYLAPDGTDGGRRLRSGGTLADLAPTMLELSGLDVPAEMTGRSLLA